ncbi:hypothetical protein C4559_02695 [Candidatus Microgenomates bacterium]|nr:MAG: hypothetical protein C4559_02695 [Candidatus Microgenomates bacterium]
MDKKIEDEKAVMLIAQSSFELWKSKDFRALVSFEKIDQTEQDRIFNELEVTALGLLMLYSQETFSSELRDLVVNNFLNLMSGLGIEEQFIDIWRKLIAKRFEEYKKDYNEALEVSKDMKEFKNEEKLRITWSRIETLVIDGLTHIRKGKVDEQDPLWSVLRKWLIVVDASLIQLLKLTKLQIPQKELN